MQQTVRTVLWRNTLEPGLDHCLFSQNATGLQFDGMVVQTLNERPARIAYQIDCDHAWQTRSVTLDTTLAGQHRRLYITVDDHRRWWQDGVELVQCAGLIDIDLGVTSATNTLPMRRLSLAVGERRPVTAAWMRFPELTIQPLPQQYTRLAEQQYLYQSPDFQAELLVDDLGLVIQYGNWFERIATHP